MNSSTVAITFLLFILTFCSSCLGQQSDDDIDTLLNNRNFVMKQIKCVLGKGRCDSFGLNLKDSIPKALTNNCESCTPEEAELAKKLSNFVKENYPDAWKKILQRYSK